MMITKPTLMQSLYQSLLPYPGRGNQVLRTVVSCVLVIIISLTLQIPWLSLSILIVFFVTQTNVIFTKIIGILFIVAATVSIGLSMLILITTWNTPFLRVLFSALVFLVSCFLMRTSKIGVIFFVVAIVAIYVQSLVDIAPSAEELVRAILWVWVATVYSIAVTLIVNTLLLPVEPEKQLQDGMFRQLNIIAESLDLTTTLPLEQRDVTRIGADLQALYKYLRFSVMRNDPATFDQKSYLEQITVISELRALSAQLSIELDNEQDKLAAIQIRDAVIEFHHALKTHEIFYPEQMVWVITDNVILQEMAHVLRSYARGSNVKTRKKQNQEQENKENNIAKKESAKKPFLVEDAFTNSKYIAFALKTSMTVLLSYIFYTATDWTGIHTIMLSCLIVAQPGLGNTQRKILLRVSGAAIGSILALIAIVLILPQLDSLFGLLLLVIPVLFIASWVATGPENISYAGIQIIFTFALAILESMGPVYDLTEVRDRIIGIIAGIIFAGLVHSFIAPEREGAIVLDKLADLIDKVRKHGLIPSDKQSKASRADIMVGIAECEELISQVALEPAWTGTEGAHDTISQRAQEIFIATKSIISNTDSLSLQFNRIAKNLTETEYKNAIALLNAYEYDLDVISDWLRGKQVGYAKYPDIPQDIDTDFQVAAQIMKHNIEQFFRIMDNIIKPS